MGVAYAKGRQEDYVLSPFSKVEMDDLVLNMDRAKDASLAFCTIGLDRAMNQFNG